jgi:hypothetical protein
MISAFFDVSLPPSNTSQPKTRIMISRAGKGTQAAILP